MEATSLLRTNILAVVIVAEANLGMVTNTNFTLALTAQETASVAVTIDYGDIQLLRAMLDGFGYFIYNTYDWNLDVQLTVIRSFYSANVFSISGLLAACPNLLSFASTNDLSSAESAFPAGKIAIRRPRIHTRTPVGHRPPFQLRPRRGREGGEISG